jgi:hypothetical protein
MPARGTGGGDDCARYQRAALIFYLAAKRCSLPVEQMTQKDNEHKYEDTEAFVSGTMHDQFL